MPLTKSAEIIVHETKRRSYDLWTVSLVGHTYSIIEIISAHARTIVHNKTK